MALIPGHAVPEPVLWSGEFGLSRQDIDRTLQPFTRRSLLLLQPELMGHPLSKLLTVDLNDLTAASEQHPGIGLLKLVVEQRRAGLFTDLH